jgi:hypothetical protein
MNTRPHQQWSQGNAAPAEEQQPPGTTTQTWDQCRHNTLLPEVFHGTVTPVSEANAGLFHQARTVGTAGGRP